MEDKSTLSKRIDKVKEQLLNIQKINGSFVLKEAIKQIGEIEQ